MTLFACASIASVGKAGKPFPPTDEFLVWHSACTVTCQRRVLVGWIKQIAIEGDFTGIIGHIYGLLVGIVGKLLTLAREPGGFILTIFPGIGGDLVGGFVGQSLRPTMSKERRHGRHRMPTQLLLGPDHYSNLRSISNARAI